MINPKTKRFSLVKNVEEDFFLATATNVKTNFKFQATDFADDTEEILESYNLCFLCGKINSPIFIHSTNYFLLIL